MHEEAFRQEIIENPEKLLADTDVVRALFEASGPSSDRKVIDLRSAIVHNLEARLGVLQDTHRDVVAAAYDNLAGTNQVHRAVLAFLRPQSFEEFVSVLTAELMPILAVDGLHLCLEAEGAETGHPMGPEGADKQTVLGLPLGGIEAYCGPRNAHRKVILRSMPQGADAFYGDYAKAMASEAVVRLDFGSDKARGMLIMGAVKPDRFYEGQASDLLEFLGGALESALLRWLG